MRLRELAAARSEVAGQLLADLLGSDLRGEARDDLPGPIDQELREIPGNVGVAVLVRLLRFQEIVEVTGPVAVDFDLREERKSDTVSGFRELQDFGVAAGLLAAELIARESEDREVLRAEAFEEGMQTCILGGESSLARQIDDQADLAPILRQGDAITRNQRRLEVVEASHGTLLLWMGVRLAGRYAAGL
jgi:hypothetical protein